MNQVIIVSHGGLAQGLHDTLKMFVNADQVLSIGLKMVKMLQVLLLELMK